MTEHKKSLNHEKHKHNTLSITSILCDYYLHGANKGVATLLVGSCCPFSRVVCLRLVSTSGGKLDW